MLPGSVVPDREPPTEAEFRAAMLAGLARCSNTPTRKRSLAAEMDLSSKGLGNILEGGATPGPKRLFDALRSCPAVLDNILALYGFELVRREGAAEAPATAPLAALLARIAAAESPDSPGGATKTHTELLPMEPDLRVVHRLTGGLLDEIDRIRTPRAVA
jgi:hypothetical protein